MSPFTIRLATDAEIDRIFSVHHQSVAQLCGQSYTGEQIRFWLEGRSPGMYLDAIRHDSLWVADDGDILGFVETEGDEVSKLFVRGDRAHAGVGKALLDKAVTQITGDGHARVYLESTKNACPFYERHGFAVIGHGHFSRGSSPIQLEIVKMEKKILS